MRSTRIPGLLTAAMVVVAGVAVTAAVGMISEEGAQPTQAADVVYAQAGRP